MLSISFANQITLDKRGAEMDVIIKLSGYIVVLALLILTSCSPVQSNLPRNFADENPSSGQNEDSLIHINVPDSPEPYNDDFLKQMYIWIGGGNEGGFTPYDVEVEITGNIMTVKNLPKKTITLVIYRIDNKLDYRGYPVYQFYSDHQIHPNEDGTVKLEINLMSSDAFIIVADGKMIYKNNHGLLDLRLHIGESAYICTKSDRVNLRSQPGYSNEILVQMLSGESIDIIGGPAECDFSYCWWQVETKNGVIGWVVDGGDAIDEYYVCPFE
jgi:hypothetical protein